MMNNLFEFHDISLAFPDIPGSFVIIPESSNDEIMRLEINLVDFRFIKTLKTPHSWVSWRIRSPDLKFHESANLNRPAVELLLIML